MTAGQSVVLSATVKLANSLTAYTGADAQVTFFDGGTQIGTAPADSTGHASVTVTFSSSGPHALTAQVTPPG